MYASDHGLEELARRRGDDEVTAVWLAARLEVYGAAHPSAVLSDLASWVTALGEDFTLAELADGLRGFVDAQPEAEDVVNGFSSWLARADDEDD